LKRCAGCVASLARRVVVRKEGVELRRGKSRVRGHVGSELVAEIEDHGELRRKVYDGFNGARTHVASRARTRCRKDELLAAKEHQENPLKDAKKYTNRK
jgi:hypothetical protein